MSPPEAGLVSWLSPEAEELVPPGFGRGRRTGNIAIVHTVLSQSLPIPERVPQWGPEEELDSWTRPMLSAAATGAEMAGFNLLWYYWRRGETAEAVANRLFPGLADGAIVLAPRAEHLPLVSLLIEREVPCVIAYARHPEPRLPWVVCDNAGGVREAVRHLVGLGHRRIGFIGGPSSIADFAERKEGFLRAMAEAGLSVDPALLREAGHRRGVEDVRPLALELLRCAERPSALMCATDAIAIGAIQAAWDLGLQVPDDVAVVGFDDAEEAVQVSPRLTTVRQPIREIASRATYLVACAIVGQRPETATWHIEYPAPLIIRESCGASAQEAAAPSDGAVSLAQRRRMRQLEAENEELRGILYVASHDLRSPLITIKGFAQRLAKQASQLDDKVRDSVERIVRAVASLEELLEGLLSLSRSFNQPLNLEPVSAQWAVEQVLTDLAGLVAAKGAHISVAAGLPMVTADEIKLRQVFMNLISNALKYTHPDRRPEVHIGFVARAAEVEFYVQDNGPGIPPELQERIFEPFQRGPNAAGTEGAGLGLSTVRSIIIRHGGRIWVESTPGEGATFRFTLPIGKWGPAASPSAPERQP